jgi:hypothetical protein
MRFTICYALVFVINVVYLRSCGIFIVTITSVLGSFVDNGLLNLDIHR